jgi:hypothetical protein
MKFKDLNNLRLKTIFAVSVYLASGLSLYSQAEKQLVIGQQPGN